MPKRADLPALVARQMRLRAILDHPELVLARDRHDRIHVGRLPVQMHRDDADGARRDRGLDRRGIDREGAPSVSAKTTLAPAWVIIADVLIHECAVVMTSSPG